MTTERRKSQRRAISRPAAIEIAPGLPARDCLITDLSEGGVRLYIETAELPDRFVLWFSADDRRPRPRDCSVVWRLGHELGVKFTDTHGRDRQVKSTTAADEPAAV